MLLSPICTQPVPCNLPPMVLPLAGWRVVAGFPSPAEEFNTQRVDLTQQLVKHPQATFLARASGRSMESFGIHDGSVLVVDKAVRERSGHIVLAVVDGDFTVKQLQIRQGRMRLVAGNPTFPDIVPREGQTIEIWGVVTSVITEFKA
jgi:DNA polymerase V